METTSPTTKEKRQKGSSQKDKNPEYAAAVCAVQIIRIGIYEQFPDPVWQQCS
jgi:hypothetical protein